MREYRSIEYLAFGGEDVGVFLLPGFGGLVRDVAEVGRLGRIADHATDGVDIVLSNQLLR